MAEPIQDEISFTLMAEHTVVNDTVKIVAGISGIITSEMTEDKLKDSIRKMMRRLIKDAQWNFANVTRRNHASGMEQIDLEASARVSEKENYGLEKRAREVSQEGMSVTEIRADSDPPRNMLDGCESELRIRLLGMAVKERDAISKAMGASYRIGEVNFRKIASASLSNNASRGGSTRIASASSYGTSYDDEDGLGNAVKLTMEAAVTLSKSVETV